MEGGVSSLGDEGRNYGGVGEIEVRNFRFVLQIFGGVILLIESKLTPPNGSLRARCGGHSCRKSVQALPRMLCHAPSIGSCSQYCLILQPHRVAVPFPPTFSSPWRNSFVQIHGGTTLLKANFGTTPQKRPKNDLNWGVGSSYGTNKPPLPNPSFPYEYISPYINHAYIYMYIHYDMYICIHIHMPVDLCMHARALLHC